MYQYFADYNRHNSPDGSAIASAHADGTIMRFYFEEADSTGGSAAVSKIVTTICNMFSLIVS